MLKVSVRRQAGGIFILFNHPSVGSKCCYCYIYRGAVIELIGLTAEVSLNI
jgi:hypothetical protein